jgi:uncharacterized integral membrane protein
MPWKFIVFIIICILLSLFIGVNLDNKTDISFVFVSIAKVPVFLVALFAFAFGGCAGILAAVLRSSRKKKKEKQKKIKKQPAEEKQGQRVDEIRNVRKRK